MTGYEQYLGTRAWPATEGLWQAIAAGIVVADEHGFWTLSKRAMGLA